MIGYAMVGSNDLPKARAFYDALFGTIGVGVLAEFPNGACGYGPNWQVPMFGLGMPYDGEAATPGNGQMIALVMDTRDKVDAVYAKAMELGAADEGGPGVRGEDGEGAFYAAYFRDLDGNKLCVFRSGGPG